MKIIKKQVERNYGIINYIFYSNDYFLFNNSNCRQVQERGIETDSNYVLRAYTYAFTVIEMWLSMIFVQGKLYVYLGVFGLMAYFVYRTLTEDIL